MKINILGTGIMGTQIISLFYLIGYNVNVWDINEVDMKRINKTIKMLKKTMKDSQSGSISIINSLDELENNITIESLIEDIEIKKDIYNKVKKKVNKIYYSNSSSYKSEEIGKGVKTLHFFNPIQLKIVEGTTQDESDSYDEILNILKANDFVVINVQQNRGYLGNYLIFSEISTVFKLIEKYDYRIGDIKKIYNTLYDGRDIFKIIDIIGIETTQKIMKNLNQEDDKFYIPQLFQKAISLNILGKKNKTSITSLIE